MTKMALIDVRYFCHKGMYAKRGNPRVGKDDFWNIYYFINQAMGVPRQFIHCISVHGSAIDARFPDTPIRDDDFDLEETLEALEKNIREQSPESTLILSNKYVFGDFAQTYLKSERLAHIERFYFAAKKFSHLQLLEERAVLLVRPNGDANYHEYTQREAILEQGDIPFRLYRAIIGDNGQVPGVKGIGEKTATELLLKYSTIPTIYYHLDDLKPGIRKCLEADPSGFRRSYLLAGYVEVEDTSGYEVVKNDIPETTPKKHLSEQDDMWTDDNDNDIIEQESEVHRQEQPMEFNSQEYLRHYIERLAKRLTIDEPLIFFDLETTGIDTKTAKIVQFFGLRINPDLTTQTVEVLINPQIPIPEAAKAIHGITDQMVAGAPTFTGHALAISDLFHGTKYVLGYNILGFDMPILMREFAEAEMDFDVSNKMYIDVFELEKKIVTHKLGEAFQRYTGKELVDAHGAGADTLATLVVFFHQLGTERYAEYHEWAKLEGESRGEDAVDLSGKLKRDEQGRICFNIGKEDVKGQPILSNPGFAKWILAKDFPEDTKAIIREELATYNGVTHVDRR